MLPRVHDAVDKTHDSILEVEKSREIHVKWRPLYLRRRVLFAFIFSFCAIIATLAALDQVSKANSGLATSIQSRHYIWTYGPTAILTVVAALWARVEFQTKQNAPWQEMLSSPRTEAKKSILLDYVSMMQPVAIVKAIQNRHYFVAASVASALILRLLIIFSTGLFSLQPTPIEKGQVQVQLSTSIDTFNGSTRLKTASAKAYDNLNSIIYKNAPYAEGTNANTAYQIISSTGLPSDASINTTIDAIAAGLDCEVASFNSANFSIYGEGTLITPSCNMTVNFNRIWNNNDLRLISQVGPIQKCDNSDNKDDQRIPIFVGTTFFSTDHPGINGNPPLINLSLSDSNQHICKPTYAVQNITANLNTTGSYSTSLGQAAKTRTPLKNLTAVDIATQAFSYSDTYLKAPTPADNDELFIANNLSVDLSLTLGARLSGFEGSAQDIFDRNMGVDLFTTYYHAITAQVVGESLFQPKQSETSGQAITTENRLLVTELSLYAMEVCLSALVLLVAVMIYLKAYQAVAPWNPNTLVAMASLLSTNLVLRESIRGTGLGSEDSLVSHLASHTYTARPSNGSLDIEVQRDRCGDQRPSQHTLGSWKPFPNLYSRVGFYIILVGVIASLEGVLHVSQTQNGLGTVHEDTYAHYSWTLIPALVMVSISLCFGSIDFNVRSLAPYARLKKQAGVDWQYLGASNFMDSLSLVNILTSIKMKEFAVVMTTLATIIGSLLTIVSSGLYSAIDISVISKVNLTQESVPIRPLTFSHELSVMNQANLTNAMQDVKYGVTGTQTASEIFNNNLTFPQWTWNEFAFPNMTLQTSLADENVTGLFVDIVVPALRSHLDCQLRNSSALPHNFTAMPKNPTSPYAGPTLLVNATALPCFDNETVTSQQTQIRGASMNTAVEGKYLPVGYFGSTSANLCYLNGTALQATRSRNTLYNFNQNQVSYTWGQTTANSLVNVVELACMDSPETVETKIRLKLPSLTIDESHPPVANESTAKRAEHALLPLSDAWYYLQSYEESATGMDSFFQALVSGKYSIPQEYLRDPSKTETIVEAIKYQHKLIRAQQLGLDAQQSANNTLRDTPLVGNFTNPSHRRLFQDATSTRILESLLAVMLVLGISSSIFLNTDDVLPKNPNSIAALASLLVDSNFLDFFQYVPDPTDEKIGETVFSRSRFFLGWLDDQGSPDRNALKGSTLSAREDYGLDNSNFTIYVDDYEGSPCDFHEKLTGMSPSS